MTRTITLEKIKMVFKDLLLGKAQAPGYFMANF